MSKYGLIIPLTLVAFGFFLTACSSSEKQSKLQGNWKSKDGTVSLSINSKKFIMDNEEQNAEDYFVKGDTIFTSFEGNQPYTKFVIQKLDESQMSLLFPDSVLVEFAR